MITSSKEINSTTLVKIANLSKMYINILFQLHNYEIYKAIYYSIICKNWGEKWKQPKDPPKGAGYINGVLYNRIINNFFKISLCSDVKWFPRHIAKWKKEECSTKFVLCYHTLLRMHTHTQICICMYLFLYIPALSHRNIMSATNVSHVCNFKFFSSYKKSKKKQVKYD